LVRSSFAWLVLGITSVLSDGVMAAPPAETLLTNGGFDSDVQLSGWDFGNALASWSSLDVASEAGSGSARIENAFPEAGFSFEISHCVATLPGAHALGASYWIPSGQAPAAGDAGVRWFFHAGEGCDPGAFLAAGQISTENIMVVPDQWGELSIDGVVAPPGTGSARLFLVDRKESVEGTFAAHFDDAYLIPEPGAAALAPALLAALGLLSACGRRR
jgi:hypothetical protein